VYVATVQLNTAVQLLAEVVSHFSVPTHAGRDVLERGKCTQPTHFEDRISLVLLIETFTDSLLEHEQAERDRLLQFFRIVDVDKSGSVDFQEFKTLLSSVPGLEAISNFEIAHMFTDAIQEQHIQFNDDEEPQLSESAFVMLCTKRLKSVLKRDLLDSFASEAKDVDVTYQVSYQSLLSNNISKIFKKYADGDKGIAASNFATLVQEVGSVKLSKGQLSAAFEKVDSNRNEYLNYHEFLEWWRDFVLRNAFEANDNSETGTLNPEELRSLLSSLHIVFSCDEDFFEAFAKIDEDGDGVITFEEVVNWFAVFNAHAAFTEYDTDNSNSLDPDELIELFAGLGLTLSKEHFQVLTESSDKNSDGDLSFSEFLPVWVVLYEAEKNKKNDEAAILDALKKKHAACGAE